MLRSCKYCGKIHDSKFDCGKRPKRENKKTDKDKFRWTEEWKKKREEIKQRDYYLCQACIRNLPGTVNVYNHKGIQVHHNISLEEDFEKRSDNNNLISLCKCHHEMAEKGIIARVEVQEMIRQQEESTID